MNRYTKDLLEPLVKSSFTMVELLNKLGLKSHSGAANSHIKKRIIHFGIDTSHFRGMSWAKGLESTKRKEPDAILVNSESDRRTPTSQLRRALLQSGIPNCCSECHVGSVWNGKSLVLQVDHKDGNWKNNSIKNLRFLCPNCHSQTDSFSRAKTKKRQCQDCDIEIGRGSVTCYRCSVKRKFGRGSKILWPDILSLKKLVEDFGFAETGRQLGVTGNTVKNRLQTHERLGM